jgi:hypothetical protein
VLQKSLDVVARWGYWENTGCYMPGTNRDNAVWIESLISQFHAYLQDLLRLTLIHNGFQMSLGGRGSFLFTMARLGRNHRGSGHQQPQEEGAPKSNRHVEPASVLLARVFEITWSSQVLGNTALRNSGKPGSVTSAGDYSYSGTS